MLLRHVLSLYCYVHARSLCPFPLRTCIVSECPYAATHVLSLYCYVSAPGHVSLCYRVFASDCNSERAPFRSVPILLRTCCHCTAMYAYPITVSLCWRCIVPLCPNAVTYMQGSLESLCCYARVVFELLCMRTRSLCPFAIHTCIVPLCPYIAT